MRNIMIEPTENIELVRPLFKAYMWHMKSYYEIADISAWIVRANEYFDLYRTDAEKIIYSISNKTGLFGFALVSKEYRCNASGSVISDFYIIPEMQGCGNGTLLAEYAFLQNPGMWEVSVASENENGFVFWSKVISKYTNNEYVNQYIDSYNGAVFSFSSA